MPGLCQAGPHNTSTERVQQAMTGSWPSAHLVTSTVHKSKHGSALLPKVLLQLLHGGALWPLLLQVGSQCMSEASLHLPMTSSQQ